jgi:copper(I)-binding protein
MRWYAVAVMLILLGLSSPVDAHSKLHGSLKIVHPYTVETAAAETETTVRMSISTDGNADELISASTPIADSAIVYAGPATTLKHIAVPTNGTVELTRSGPHILLKGLRKRLVGYDSFPLILSFEKGGQVEVEVMVEERE